MTKRNAKRSIVIIVGLLALLYFSAMNINLNPNHEVGEVVDELNGVKVYYNGAINTTSARNLSPDGYNIGLKYQCVEFVKRYYYEHFQHKMPESRGHAKDFFDPTVPHGEVNKARGLLQFYNRGNDKPAVNDLVVFKPWLMNRFGHVAIVSKVTSSEIEVIQQNPGPFGSTRETYALKSTQGRWFVENERLLGWLRLPSSRANPSFNRTPKALHLVPSPPLGAG